MTIKANRKTVMVPNLFGYKMYNFFKQCLDDLLDVGYSSIIHYDYI